MTVLALACAKGSPGVTTAVLALAATWPRRVLVVEADPAGGDLAARWQRPPTPGLLSLAALHTITTETLWEQAQTLTSATVSRSRWAADEQDRLKVLLGPVLPEQAVALGRLWGSLGAVVGRLGCDVLIDCGRLSMGAPVMPLLHAADRVLLVARPTPEGLAHLRGRLAALGRDGLAVEVILVGERPYSAAEVADTFQVEVLGVLPEDRNGAGMLGGLPGSARRLAAAPLIRAARGLADLLSRPATRAPIGTP